MPAVGSQQPSSVTLIPKVRRPMAGDYMLGAHEATRRSLLPGHRRPAHARPAAGLAVGVQSLALGGRSEVGARANRLDEQKEFSRRRGHERVRLLVENDAPRL